MIYRITLNPKPEQRIAIQIYDEEKSAKTFLRKFGDGKLNEIRDTGARVEVFEGLIDKFDHLLENLIMRPLIQFTSSRKCDPR